jgi:hypothetical protein
MNDGLGNRRVEFLLTSGVGLVFLIAGLGKILDPVTFYENILGYQLLPAAFAWAVAFYLPWLEGGVGLAFWIPGWRKSGWLVAGGLCLVFLLMLGSAWARGLTISCGCFAGGGMLDSIPVAILKNLILLATMARLGRKWGMFSVPCGWSKESGLIWRVGTIMALLFLTTHPLQAQEMDSDDGFRIKPSKIFLGSLAYGGDQPGGEIKPVTIELKASVRDWEITEVELLHAAGVRAARERVNPYEWRLHLTFDGEEMVRDLPFGSLVTRWVRVETSLPENPLALIRLTGLLSKNETDRNFSDFVFQGRKRWQGWWGTPNMAGSLLAVVLVLGSGLAACSLILIKDPRRCWVSGLLALVLLAPGFWLLASTYSRGAWIAWGLGWILLLLFSRPPQDLRKRWWHAGRLFLLAAGLLMLGCLGLLPGAAKRAGSTVAMEEDLSVRNRLWVWEGAWQMMADHPWRGVGPGKFGAEFAAGYQKRGHRDDYSTAISDYLTWGAERGIPVLAVGLGAALALVALGFIRSREQRGWNGWLPPFSAALASFGGAGVFSTLWFVRDWQILFGILVLFLLILLLLDLWQRGDIFRNLQKMAALMALSVILVGLALLGVGQGLLTRLPTRIEAEKSADGFMSWTVAPRHQSSKGFMVYFQDRQEKASEGFRDTYRPLAEQGWTVLVYEESPGAHHFPEIRRLVSSRENEANPTLVLAGHYGGAETAYAFRRELAEHEPERPTVLAVFGWKGDEDWLAGASSPNPPRTLVVLSLYDDKVLAHRWLSWQRKNWLPVPGVDLQMSKSMVGKSSESWQRWLDALETLLAEQG